jgi:hypothetical protein
MPTQHGVLLQIGRCITLGQNTAMRRCFGAQLFPEYACSALYVGFVAIKLIL